MASRSLWARSFPIGGAGLRHIVARERALERVWERDWRRSVQRGFEDE